MSVDNFQLHTKLHSGISLIQFVILWFLVYIIFISCLFTEALSCVFQCLHVVCFMFLFFLFFSGFMFLLCCFCMSLPACDDCYKEILKQYIHCYLETILFKCSKTVKLNLNLKIQGLILCACVDYSCIFYHVLHTVYSHS